MGVDATLWDLYGSGIFDACEPDAIINHAATWRWIPELLGLRSYWLATWL